MDVEKNRERWIEALIGGDFRQARKSLHGGGGHCCLGVAHCLMHPDGGWEEGPVTHVVYSDIEGWLGLREFMGSDLVEMNDVQGMSFAAIARRVQEIPGRFFE